MNRFSIGIPVYNEEENIANLLKAIKKQDCGDFVMDKIYLYDDNSKDKTVANIKKTMDGDEWLAKKIILLESEKNYGKAHGLNRIFAANGSDILVLLDSDLFLKDDKILFNLLRPMYANEKIGLAGGWYEFTHHKSFLRKVLGFSAEILKELAGRKKFYGAWGGLLALRTDLIFKNGDRSDSGVFFLPENIFRDDAYLYFRNKKLGREFVFVPEAKVVDLKNFDKLSMKWFIKGQKMFRGYPDVFYKDFSREMIERETGLSSYEKASAFMKVFLKNPVDGLFYVICKTIAFVINAFKPVDNNHLWRR